MASRKNAGKKPEREVDTVAVATRALVDATAALSRLLGKQIAVAGEEVDEAIAVGLRDASRGLADASESVERRVGTPGAAHAAQRRRDRVDRTRAELLAAAGRVFAAHGFDGASVEDVAGAAGYTKGAVYAHFGSKSDLFMALAREQVLCGGDPVGGDGAADLGAEISRGLAASPTDASMLLALEVIAYAVRHPESRSELAPILDTSMARLAERVRDDRHARGAGEAGADASASAAAPTEEDYDTALALLAIGTVAPMLAAVSDAPQLSAAAGSRVVARLLAR